MMDAQDLRRYIETHGVEAELVSLENKTPTVEAAAEAVGVQPEQIAKSVLFAIKEADDSFRPLLVVANGLARISYKKLAGHLDVSRRRLRMARPKQVLAMTGYEVGTVPPFGHKQSLQTLVDEGLTHQEVVYAGGGAIDVLLRIPVSELQRVLQAEIVSLVEPEEKR